ncbi:MAG TPA: HepT-like ribonuclease domain-containing protein [Candidatus Dormibacteraeota bacterium]|nr:HepT-like ribonuclease domain-containing protein [Candidatus Dormibacteraeota bacterium]
MKEPVILLEHILESIEVIERVLPKTEQAFTQSSDVQDIVIRRLEIIGEAARYLPEELKQVQPEADWRRLTDLRNLLIHEYFNVDVGLLWNNTQHYLPILKQAVQELIKQKG